MAELTGIDDHGQFLENGSVTKAHVLVVESSGRLRRIKCELGLVGFYLVLCFYIVVLSP